MKLPDNIDYFVESTITTGKQLIERGFWEIPESRLDSWWRQFCGHEEKFFAACLLDQTIFRSRHQFESALRALFRSNLFGAVFPGEHDLCLTEAIQGRPDPKIRLIPVICESDPPTKSGPLVMRRLQRILRLNSKWMCWPWLAPQAIEEQDVEIIVFVDDFLGSGRQFETFFEKWDFPKKLDSRVKYIYAPVIAHQVGLDYLAKVLPSVTVVCVEKLGDSHRFFNETTWHHIGQGQVTADDAKTWYLDFATKRKIAPRSVSPLGYGELELAFGFSHATPNNSLPILWCSSEDWQPLLER